MYMQIVLFFRKKHSVIYAMGICYKIVAIRMHWLTIVYINKESMQCRYI